MQNNNPSTNPSATSPEKAAFIANQAQQNYQGPSIVDFLNLSGADSSPTGRDTLAKSYGINNSGTAEGNTALLSKLRGGGTPAGTGTGTGTQTPTDTTTPPQSAADLAFAKYLEALTPSAEEKTAKSYVDKLVSDSKFAREKALNEGETMGFAGGEAGRVQRNNDLSIGAAKDAYDTVKSFRQREGEVGKIKYDYEKGKVDDLKEQTKPFELSPGQQRYAFDLKSGTYKVVASAPKTTATPKLKAPTQTQQKNADIFDAVTQLATIKEQQGFMGVPADDYETLRDEIEQLYGSAGVKALDAGLKTRGLKTMANTSKESTLDLNKFLKK